TELDDILAAIGSTVILSCHLHLETPPKEMSLVNVYLDRQLVEYGGPDGWVWTHWGDAGAGDGAVAEGGAGDGATGDDAPGSDDATPTDDAPGSDDATPTDDAAGDA